VHLPREEDHTFPVLEMTGIAHPFAFIILLSVHQFAAAAAEFGITMSPPDSLLSAKPAPAIFRRQESCPYGKCGDDCLSQGAFCCNPAGTDRAVPSCKHYMLQMNGMSQTDVAIRGMR
jgi:hypothetical protein